MPSSNSSVTSGSPKRNWIREASMKRLNMLMRNKAECLTDTFADNSINLNDLERSGLNDIERNTIDRWIRGQLSGRHCLLALLEHRLVESEEKNIKSFTTGAVQHPIEFEMLSSSLSLPNDFLCDSGYLYESTFSKPPGTVIKEALQMLATKAMEKNISSLRVDQINLSLKQLRVDMLHDSVMSIDNEKGKENSSDNTLIKSHNTNTDGNNDTSLMANKVSNNKEANTYRLSILIELIRWHIRTNHKDYNNDENNNNKQKESNHKNMKGNGNNNGNNDSELHKTVKSSPFSSSSSSSFFSHSSSHIDAATVVKHLDCNLERVVEEAKQLSTDDLEQLNILLKPYVRQLSSLKSSLTIQLKDFEEKKAYISLGVSKDASDSVIRKAYHSKAVQLHPDKPGGDTAKFQALQTCYQEIINKRKTEQVATNVTLSPAAQEESLQANNILKELASCLDLIKAAADKCTQLGHLNIQFQKLIEKSSKKEFPEGVKSLVKLLSFVLEQNNNSTSTITSAGAVGTIMTTTTINAYVNNKKKNSCKVDMASCSPAIAVSHVEAVCESMQILSALSMKLPSCGFRYGLATAINSKYMKAVEKAMATGLSAMRVVSALISANDQIYLCRKKLLESATSPGIDNSDIHEILVDMIVTSFNSATMTVQMAADKCVDAAINAADLYGIIKSIIHSAEEEAINEAKRTAAREEKDADLCEEDRVFMAERSKQAREEAMAKHRDDDDDELMNHSVDKTEKDKQKEKENNKTDDDDNDDDDDTDLLKKGKSKKKKKQQADNDDDDDDDEAEANGSIESLRDKIKTLQLKLRLQHIQALQSLNTEARTLQLQLQQQLYDIVIGTVNTENIAHKMIVQKQTIARQLQQQQKQEQQQLQQEQQQQQEQEQLANDATVHNIKLSTEILVEINIPSSSSSSSSSSLNNASTPPLVPVQPLRNSVLSLLADFIDSSCNSLREELDNNNNYNDDDDGDDGNGSSSLLLLQQKQQQQSNLHSHSQSLVVEITCGSGDSSYNNSSDSINSNNNNNNTTNTNNTTITTTTNTTSNNATITKPSLEWLLQDMMYKHLGWMTVLTSTPRTPVTAPTHHHHHHHHQSAINSTTDDPLETSKDRSFNATTTINTTTTTNANATTIHVDDDDDDDNHHSTSSSTSATPTDRSLPISHDDDDDDEDNIFHDAITQSKNAKDELDAALRDNNSNDNSDDDDDDDINNNNSGDNSNNDDNNNDDDDDGRDYDTARDDASPNFNNNNNNNDDDDDDDTTTVIPTITTTTTTTPITNTSTTTTTNTTINTTTRTTTTADNDQNQAENSETETTIPPPTPPPLFSTSETKSLNILRVGPKLALLPDYRSKTLWLSALVDEEAVVSLVSLELKARLVECLKRVLLLSSTRSKKINDYKELSISPIMSRITTNSTNNTATTDTNNNDNTINNNNANAATDTYAATTTITTTPITATAFNVTTSATAAHLSAERMADDLCGLIIEGVRCAVQELRTVNSATSNNSARASDDI